MTNDNLKITTTKQRKEMAKKKKKKRSFDKLLYIGNIWFPW